MKRYSFVWASLLMAGSAGCQPQLQQATSTSNASAKPTPVLPPLPLNIIRQIPRGAKSCFAGILSLPPSGPDFLIHLYNEHPKKDLNPDKRDGKYHFTVSIFQTPKLQGRAGYRLLKKFPLNYRGEIWAPTTFKAQLLWLDPQQKHKPMIKFDCFLKGDYGPLGDNVLAVFPHGFAGQPIIQDLAFGAWRASNISGQYNTFDSVDKKGLLQVSAQFSLATSEIPEQPPVVLRWNGKKFATNSANGNRMLNGYYPEFTNSR